MNHTFSQPFNLLLGRKTYDIFAAHWPYVETDPQDSDFDQLNADIAKTFNRITKYVATHRPELLSWQNSQGLGSDVAATVRDLKKGDGSALLTQAARSSSRYFSPRTSLMRYASSRSHWSSVRGRSSSVRAPFPQHSDSRIRLSHRAVSSSRPTDAPATSPRAPSSSRHRPRPRLSAARPSPDPNHPTRTCVG